MHTRAQTHTGSLACPWHAHLQADKHMLAKSEWRRWQQSGLTSTAVRRAASLHTRQYQLYRTRWCTKACAHGNHVCRPELLHEGLHGAPSHCAGTAAAALNARQRLLPHTPDAHTSAASAITIIIYGMQGRQCQHTAAAAPHTVAPLHHPPPPSRRPPAKSLPCHDGRQRMTTMGRQRSQSSRWPAAAPLPRGLL